MEGDERDAEAIGQSLRERPGWEIVRASTLLEAIREAGDSRFDAAVLETDLPDGSGLDILDFLRIGSPGIRIMLLSGKPNESVAFHALSHGAGDFLVKDAHLDAELPRRMDALLESVDPVGALVETLKPMIAYEAPAERLPSSPRPAKAANAIEQALDEIVTGSTLAAGVWDLRGRPLASKFTKDIDPDGLGFAMGTLHGQVGALWTYGNLKPTGYRMVIDVEGGLLGVTAIPGTYIVALMLEPGLPLRRALERLDQAGMRVLAALQGGAAGTDA